MRPFATALATAIVLSATVSSVQPTVRFFADDPLEREPESQDASNVRAWDVSDEYELFRSTVGGKGDRSDRRAINANTLDEVPDSSWFTNRMGSRPTSPAQIQAPSPSDGPVVGRLVIVEAKPAGIQPGFVVRDQRGQRFFLKFDPPSHPEMASGAEVISTSAFQAFGYNVPDNFIVTVDPAMLDIGEGARTRRHGRTYSMTRRDLEDILDRAARASDGRYRAMASKALPGTALGPFRYYGTRPDDPNDLVPHEHRRELRGMRVIAAWLNHHDVKSNNSLDTLVDANRRKVLRHYLLDFGATLGSGSIEAQSRRAGNEYMWETRPTVITMLTFGLYVRPWIRVDYPDIPALGRFEADFFDPAQWKPDFPNPAFENARADDLFWGARRLAAFTDDAIRSLVRIAHFSDQRAEAALAEILSKRRDKVLQQWLTHINPIADVAIDDQHTLTFRNAAVDARIATVPSEYLVRWAAFDNDSGVVGALGEPVRSARAAFEAPASLLATAEFIAVDIRADHRDYPSWGHATRVYFRRLGSSWRTIGVQRVTEGKRD